MPNAENVATCAVCGDTLERTASGHVVHANANRDDHQPRVVPPTADQEEIAMPENPMVMMRCISLANGEPGPAGQFLQSYNADTGESVWTVAEERAMKLKAGDFYTLWRSVLPSQPVRPWDGKPNRPLTAFTVEFIPAPPDS